ncbi:hypothetical protein Tco_0345415 [Tanacetum coccineum]
MGGGGGWGLRGCGVGLWWLGWCGWWEGVGCVGGGWVGEGGVFVGYLLRVDFVGEGIGYGRMGGGLLGRGGRWVGEGLGGSWGWGLDGGGGVGMWWVAVWVLVIVWVGWKGVIDGAEGGGAGCGE